MEEAREMYVERVLNLRKERKCEMKERDIYMSTERSQP